MIGANRGSLFGFHSGCFDGANGALAPLPQKNAEIDAAQLGTSGADSDEIGRGFRAKAATDSY